MSPCQPPRAALELLEKSVLAPYAAKSAEAARKRPESPCPFRTAFQRDRDRIIHCKAFRRLAHKTQVFLNPAGDHYRTRMTHTLEVSQIARTLARSLRLNEDLTEAIALGHDLGHTPFGHSGERILNRLSPNGFKHQHQSLRVVDRLEKDGAGLNLTKEVLDGIVKHSKGQGPIFASGSQAPATYEGQVVRVSDLIAYLAHDLDDALRSHLINSHDVPHKLVKVFGPSNASRIGAMVGDLLGNCQADNSKLQLGFSITMEEAMAELRKFLYEKVYCHPILMASLDRADRVIEELYELLYNENKLPPDHDEMEILNIFEAAADRSVAVCDFIAGMTDRYAIDLYQRLFWPRPWP